MKRTELAYDMVMNSQLPIDRDFFQLSMDQKHQLSEIRKGVGYNYQAASGRSSNYSLWLTLQRMYQKDRQ